MTMLSCPLCGKQNALSSFNPAALPLDVLGVERQGLGRGKGFKVIGRPSLLADEELMDSIAARCHALITLIEGEDKTVSQDIERLSAVIDGYEEEHDACLTLIQEALPDEDNLEDAIQALMIKYDELLEELEDDDE